MGFSVLQFWPFLRLVFWFLHSKSLGFRFWYPLQFSVFPFFDNSVFCFVFNKKAVFRFLVFTCLVPNGLIALDHCYGQFFGFERFVFRFFDLMQILAGSPDSDRP